MRTGAQRNWTDAMELVGEGVPMSIRELTTLEGHRINAIQVDNFKACMIFQAVPMLMAALEGRIPDGRTAPDAMISDIMDGGLQGAVDFYFTPEERAKWAATFADVSQIAEELFHKLNQVGYVRPNYSKEQWEAFAHAYVEACFFLNEVRARTQEDHEFFEIETGELRTRFDGGSATERGDYATQVLWQEMKKRMRQENDQAQDLLGGGQ